MKEQSTSQATGRFERQWAYRPDVPIQTSPYFRWPPSPVAIWQWFAARWLVLGENIVIATLAWVCWVALQPPLEAMATLSLDWIALLWLRNLVLIALVAGGLHICLHRRKT